MITTMYAIFALIFAVFLVVDVWMGSSPARILTQAAFLVANLAGLWMQVNK